MYGNLSTARVRARTRTGTLRRRPSAGGDRPRRIGGTAPRAASNRHRSNTCRRPVHSIARGTPSKSRYSACSQSVIGARSRSRKAEKRRAFHVTRGGARGGMPQAAPHGCQLADRLPELVRLRGEHGPGRCVAARRAANMRATVKGEPGGTAQRNQRQPLQHAAVEQPVKPPPADRADQALLLVEAQRRRGHSGTLRHLRNVEVAHALDLKWT